MSSTDFQNFELQGWQVAAQNYSNSFGLLTCQSIPYILDYVKAREGESLLDIACGPGFLAEEAYKRDLKSEGIDISANMIEIAKSRNSKIEYHVGNVLNLPFSDEKFDIIASNHGIHHFADPFKAVQEMHRVAKKGARLALTLWDDDDRTIAFNIVNNAVKKFGVANSDAPKGPPMEMFTDLVLFEKTLKDLRWSNIKFEHLPIVWTLEFADDLVDILMKATVRMRSKLVNQSAEVLKQIKDEVKKDLVKYTDGYGKVKVPQGVLLAYAVK